MMTRSRTWQLWFLSLILLAGCKDNRKVDDSGNNNTDPVTTFFNDEVRPSQSLPCFDGSYYRKVVSSSDKWLGIDAVVVLPHFTFDESRKNASKPGQYLDNPSVYLGGSMSGQETDIGLTWEVIRDGSGNVTADRRAFRPFLRRAAYSATSQQATYENAPAESQYYWYPGDTVEMSVRLTEDRKLHFVVDGEGKHFEEDFDCDGYIVGGVGNFKRVNAIDQVGNEGKPVQSTKMTVTGARWIKTDFFRSYQGQVIKVPAHDHRFTDMRCPNQKYFHIAATDQDLLVGAETVDINGAGF